MQFLKLLILVETSILILCTELISHHVYLYTIDAFMNRWLQIMLNFLCNRGTDYLMSWQIFFRKYHFLKFILNLECEFQESDAFNVSVS